MPVSRETVEAFYAAHATRDANCVAPFLADDVVWTISGPVDLMEYCGMRCGKAAVLELFRTIVPGIIRMNEFQRNATLVDGDCAAVFGRISGTLPGSERVVSYRCAQLVRFRDGKVVSFNSINDSFDAAEQILGRAIDLDREPAGAPAKDDIVMM